MPPFRAAQIVGARFAFFVSLAHVKDRLKQGDGVFESGLGNRYFGFVWACLTLTIVVKTSSSAAAVWKTVAGKSNNSFLSRVFPAPGWAGNSGFPVMLIEEV